MQYYLNDKKLNKIEKQKAEKKLCHWLNKQQN